MAANGLSKTHGHLDEPLTSGYHFRLLKYSHIVSVSTILIVIQSCCSLPLIDCGPKIRMLQTRPEKIEYGLKVLQSCSLKAFLYQSRYEKSDLWLYVNLTFYEKLAKVPNGKLVLNELDSFIEIRNERIPVDQVINMNFEQRFENDLEVIEYKVGFKLPSQVTRSDSISFFLNGKYVMDSNESQRIDIKAISKI